MTNQLFWSNSGDLPPEFLDRIVRDLAKYADFWEGDVLKDREDRLWTVTNVSLDFIENSIKYKAKEEGNPKPIPIPHSRLSRMELIDEADRPEHSLDQQFDNNPTGRLEELSQARRPNEERRKQEIDNGP